MALNAVTPLERGEVDPRIGAVEEIQKASKRAGLDFISADYRKGDSFRFIYG